MSLLREGEAKKSLQLFMDSLPDGVMILARDGTIEMANQAQERLTGILNKQILGQTIFDLVHQGLYNDPVIDLVLKRKEPVTLMQYTPFQTCLLVTASPMMTKNDEIDYVVLYSKDVTELHQLQQQLEQTKLLTQQYSSEITEMRVQSWENVDIVAKSEQMKKVIDLALRLASVETTVLILGESGTGKEVVAKIIHDQSERKLGPFIKVNCSAIPESLIESELFGYEPGTFTGGRKEGKAGLFELAHNGDIFLDEIGDLALAVQPKLLRVLQEKEVVRLGGVKTRKVDVRVIAATNKDLKELVKQNRFREDLYFRLNVVPITIPPLRERKDDIIPLAYYFKEQFSKKYKVKREFSGEVLNRFYAYDWPGNVRELQNAVERLLVISSGDIITLKDLPPDLLPNLSEGAGKIIVNGLLPLKQAVLEVERQLIEQGLATFGSTLKVAEVLGVHQTTVIRKMAKVNKNRRRRRKNKLKE
ncbi:MAG: sigma 54-interacting transcriptional regulator [Bacillota bacterium]